VKICRTCNEMRSACAELRKPGSTTLGLVPTMGALHAGHLSLVAAALSECDVVAASIFVNPRQFAPGEDYDVYPRQFEEDCRKLESAGVEILFAPSAEEMYPPGAATVIDVPGIGDRLDGASRPGHFRGVATVVAKLFNIITPDRAYFGQKDAAQVAVLQAMVRDLNFAVEVVVCPTVREMDGLAMSSRNTYLTVEDRRRALILHRALRTTSLLFKRGEERGVTLRNVMRMTLAGEPLFRMEYAEVVHPATLEPVEDVQQGALLAVAGRIGTTRLIDNLRIEPVSNEPVNHG